MFVSASYVRNALDKLGFVDYEFLQAESKEDKTFKWLDQYAGVDYIIKDENNCIYTLASRIRFVRPEALKIYPEFTIRGEKYSNIKSEYLKRKQSFDNGSLYPYFTMQSWYSASVFKCGALTKTICLYEFMKRNPQAVSIQYSNRPFYCIKWEDIKDCDYPIIITGSLWENGETIVVLKSTDHIWGIEILSSTLTRGEPIAIWFVEDKNGNLFECSKRKIKSFGGKSKITEEERSNLIQQTWNDIKHERIQQTMPNMP